MCIIKLREGEGGKRVRYGSDFVCMYIVYITTTQREREKKTNRILSSVLLHNGLGSMEANGKKITTKDKIHKLIEITIKITNFIFVVVVVFVATNIRIVAESNACLNNIGAHS